VACLRLGQGDLPGEERAAARRELRGYLDLAATPPTSEQPLVVIMHGVSGSGKTHVARAVVEALGAIQVRSDVERKRLAGVSPRSREGVSSGGGIYAPDLTERTYARLRDLAEASLSAGFSVVVDATFLKRAQRDALRAVARARSVPCVILAVTAPEAVLRERIVARAQRGRDASDADLAVLDGQLRSFDPLTPQERSIAVTVNTTRAFDPAWLADAIRSRGAGE
jgi:predicted kinase